MVGVVVVVVAVVVVVVVVVDVVVVIVVLWRAGVFVVTVLDSHLALLHLSRLQVRILV